MLDSEPDNNGFINEDFIVWMRTAALPTFRKLYRLIERKSDLHPTLPAGRYYLNITYSILFWPCAQIHRIWKEYSSVLVMWHAILCFSFDLLIFIRVCVYIHERVSFHLYFPEVLNFYKLCTRIQAYIRCWC